ncbi:MAG: hypothetical protein ACRD5W_16245 [Candidatus Acidiferrales bacterium]
MPILFLLYLASACGICSNDVAWESTSPDGKLKAVIFMRNCGATTDFSTQVSILESSATLPNDSGSIFIADADHGAVLVNRKGIMDVRLTWKSQHRLVISYPGRARIFEQENVVRGVAIRYEARQD